MSISHRGSHYWLWFLVFGIIPLIKAASSSFSARADNLEAAWLVGAGLLGLLVGNSKIYEGKLAKWFDLIVGLIFTAAGILGIALWFNVGTGGASDFVSNTLGLKLGNPYPLIYAFLGLKSLHHGLSGSK